MGLHIIFLIFYVALNNILPAEAMHGVLILHCIVGIIFEINKKQSFANLITFFYIGVIIVSIANINFINQTGLHGANERSMYWYIIPKYISQATLVWCLGNTFIFIGYKALNNKSLPSVEITIHNERMIDYIFMFAIGYIILFLSGSLSILGSAIIKVVILVGVISTLFFGRLWGAVGKPKYRTYAFIIFFLQILVTLYTSFLRSDLLTTPFCLAAGYFIGKGKIKYVFSYRIIPLIAFVAIFFTFFGALGSNRAHFISAFMNEDVQQDNVSYTVESEGEESNGALVRLSNIAQLTNIVNLVEKNGFYAGQASLPLVGAVIPRFLWPDKPIVQLGAWFALEIGVAIISPTTGRANNSINMTVPGEIYLDFGWIGLAVIGGLFGALLALLWNSSNFKSSPYNFTGTIWGGFLLLYAMNGMGADLQIMISLISTYLFFLVIKKVANRNENTRHRAALAGK